MNWDGLNFRGLSPETRGYYSTAAFKYLHRLGFVQSVSYQYSQGTEMLHSLFNETLPPVVGKFRIWMTSTRKS